MIDGVWALKRRILEIANGLGYHQLVYHLEYHLGSVDHPGCLGFWQLAQLCLDVVVQDQAAKILLATQSESRRGNHPLEMKRSKTWSFYVVFFGETIGNC